MLSAAHARNYLLFLIVLATAGPVASQPEVGPLTAAEAVRIALERSPATQSAQSRLEAAAAGVRGAQAPFNPQAEIAPGIGFTNGNALLSQQIDLAGSRSARVRVAAGLRSAAQAELNLARLQAAAEVRLAYFDLVRARDVTVAAEDAAGVARRIRDAVLRRVEIGEAPQVQSTRAEIEVARAEQDVARAQGEVQGRLGALNLLLGRPAAGALTTSDVLTVPEPPAAMAELLEQARNKRPELVAVRGRVEARQGDVEVARSQRRPELFAEVASDVWSLDRDPFSSRNFGFQARLAFPLFDRGRLRAGVDRARAGVREQEAELAATSRMLESEIQLASAALSATRTVALNYRSTILPRTQELLRATRAGFDNGLTSFLEVLEAQRLARLIQTEYLNALFEATRARIALDRALGSVPGLANAPVSIERSPRK